MSEINQNLGVEGTAFVYDRQINLYDRAAGTLRVKVELSKTANM